MENKLKRIMSNIFNISEETVDENSSMDTIENWDSLQHLNLILAIEQEFKVSLSTDEVVQMVNFKVIKSTLQRKGIK